MLGISVATWEQCNLYWKYYLFENVALSIAFFIWAFDHTLIYSVKYCTHTEIKIRDLIVRET